MLRGRTLSGDLNGRLQLTFKQSFVELSITKLSRHQLVPFLPRIRLYMLAQFSPESLFTEADCGTESTALWILSIYKALMSQIHVVKLADGGLL